MLNFNHLQYFWAVAKEGNLTRTARRLRVAQSALSSQIRQLEEALGERLSVAVGASGADLGASGNRVPSCVSPLD